MGTCNYLCDRCALCELPFNGFDCENERDNIAEVNIEPDDDWCKLFTQKGLHFIHINARSLKILELGLLAQKTGASIIAVTETWYDNSILNAEVVLPGYNLVRKDRDMKGGGVCIYIKDTLPFNPLTDLTNDNIEGVWIEIMLKKTKPIIVGCVYRPPKQPDFLDQFERTLNLIPADKEVIILGDLNICMKVGHSNMAKAYKSVQNLFGFTQIIKESTRVTDKTESLLDHILVNKPDRTVSSGTLPLGFSDHNLIYCTRKRVREKIGVESITVTRSMKNYTKEELVQRIQQADWNPVIQCNDTNTAWKNFETIMNVIINSLAPFRQCKLKTRTEPWVTSELLENIRERDKYHKMFNKTKDEKYYKQFCKLRNMVQRQVRTARHENIAEQIEVNKNDSKKVWASLKTLGYSNKVKVKEPMVLEINEEICYDPVTLAEYVNDFFVNVAHKLVAILPKIVDLYSAFSENCKRYYRNKFIVPGMYTLQPVECDFVLNELKSMNSSKSTGLDNIGPRFLKDGAEVLVGIVTHLVNLSIQTKVVPDCTKKAKVTPLYKKKSKLEVGNYRPVSVLTSISKVFE